MRWDGGGRETQRIGCQAREIRKPLGKLMKLRRREREGRGGKRLERRVATGWETLWGSRLNKQSLPPQRQFAAERLPNM